MKIQTSKMIGLALDRAVAKCVGEDPRIDTPYSTEWAFGGPIIERESMCIDCFPLEKCATKENLTEIGIGNQFRGYGKTPLIAAMRCYVLSKLGNEVEIPDELL